MGHPSRIQLEELLAPGDFTVPENLLEIATLAAEFLTKTDIKIKEINLSLMLGSEEFQLEHKHIHFVRINDEAINFIGEEGVLLPNLPLDSYEVSYKVGYKNDEVPALIESLILNLAAYKLTKESSFKEAALAEAEMVRISKVGEEDG